MEGYGCEGKHQILPNRFVLRDSFHFHWLRRFHNGQTELFLSKQYIEAKTLQAM